MASPGESAESPAASPADAKRFSTTGDTIAGFARQKEIMTALRTHWRPVVQVIVCIVIAGFLIGTFLGTRNPNAQDQDFGAYYRAGQAAIAGTSPYVIDSHGPLGAYMYAPVFAHFPFRVLAKLPYLWAVRVFMLINWIATAACVWLCLRLANIQPSRSLRYSEEPDRTAENPALRSTSETGLEKPRDLLVVSLIALIPTGDYLKANLHNGQVGTLLLLACLSWLSLMLAGWSFLGGMALSIAVALKLYPALLVPYLLLRWDWRGLAGVAVGLLILFLAPAMFVGLRQMVPLHTEWLRFCFSTQVADQTLRTGNQSLLGALARLPLIGDGRQQHVSSEHLAVLFKIYPAIVLGITAGLYGFLWFVRRRSSAVADVALLLLWMTIASPRAWTFNFAAEILAAMLLATAIVDRQPRAWLAITAMCVVLLALVFPTNSLHFSDRWNLPAYIVQNKHCDALILLGIALVAVIMTPPRQQIPAQ